MPLQSLELFSGNATVSKKLRKHGYKTHTLDIRAETNPTICVDFLKWDYKKAFKPGEIDFLWASPDCKTWSIAARGKHRIGINNWSGNNRYKPVPSKYPLQPKTEYARQCNKMILRLIRVINYLKPKVWVIENPRAMLRHFPPMKRLTAKNYLVSVYYCNHGHYLRKHTDLWSNIYLWEDEKLDPEKAKGCKKIEDVGYDKSIAIPNKLIQKIFKKAGVI